MDQLNQVVVALQGVLSGKILVVLLVGTGIWFTIRLGGVQFREFGHAFKAVFGNIKLNGEKAGKDGMSSFQSLATAIAAQVGTGNLAGAATAMVMGGPGAIFWMWVSAIFGMATIFVEASLAQKYKTVDDSGEVTGGPVYYIRAAYKGTFGKVLAAIFAVLITLALGFFGNMVQANSIADAFKGAFGINPVIVGVIVAILSAFIFLGGVGRIASVTEKIVPIMATFYIIGALVLIIMNAGMIPEAFRQIFVGAFNPEAALGGFAGVAVSKAIQFGVARGLFSNEAGMGSTPHAHAVAKVKHPCDQGMVAMMGVFIDTLIILNLTAFSVLCTGQLTEYNQPLSAAALTQAAFNSGFGSFGSIFIAICMFFFAFSTIVGWYFFGEKNVRYLFGTKAVKPYAVLVTIFIVIGSALKVELVWNLSDLFNSLMVIPNVLGLWALSGVAKELYADWKSQKPAKVK
ncbi:MAG: sodium:alanine symporter family protein [Negativibacillus massiliensis]|uniref:alanine/glycine:cation symporter family protein n=1 Tax=Negativibacillus massiliensis TaxID=1871035 RepID=UPI00097784EC|nr:sodium:alanine symporter family protein [Negativibacillus massiliensis]MCI6348335.1 sodium:alanine symporter family protein [Negativibacillus massiliensis]